MERVRRIELPSSAWKAEVLPLNYTRAYQRSTQLIYQHFPFHALFQILHASHFMYDEKASRFHASSLSRLQSTSHKFFLNNSLITVKLGEVRFSHSWLIACHLPHVVHVAYVTLYCTPRKANSMKPVKSESFQTQANFLGVRNFYASA